MLADILADVEKVKAGVMSREEMVASDQLETSIGKHTKDYLPQLAGSIHNLTPFQVSTSWSIFRSAVSAQIACGKILF